MAIDTRQLIVEAKHTLAKAKYNNVLYVALSPEEATPLSLGLVRDNEACEEYAWVDDRLTLVQFKQDRWFTYAEGELIEVKPSAWVLFLSSLFFNCLNGYIDGTPGQDIFFDTVPERTNKIVVSADDMQKARIRFGVEKHSRGYLTAGEKERLILDRITKKH